MTNKARKKRKELGVRTGHRRRGAANALRPAAETIQVSLTTEAGAQRAPSPDPTAIAMGRTLDEVPALFAKQIGAHTVNSKALEGPDLDSAANALAKTLNGTSENSAMVSGKETKDLFRQPLVDAIERTERMFRNPLVDAIERTERMFRNPLVDAIERTERMFRNPLVDAIERTERMFRSPFQSYLDKMERIRKNPFDKYEGRMRHLRGDDETGDA